MGFILLVLVVIGIVSWAFSGKIMERKDKR